MMRSLWTAASGMTAQQRNMDTISNNLANVNTTGYKKERMEFKSLLYETMQSADLDPASQTGRPANLQVGHGVRPAATGRVFTQGNLQSTGYPLDLAIEGDGFFAVDRGGGDIVYTRDGSLKISPTQNGLELVTADGFAYLGTDGEPIYLPVNTLVNDIIVGPDGGITVRDANGQPADTGYQLDLNQFSNMQGLEAVGGNFFKATSASGDPIQETGGGVTQRSALRQGVLESSNVQVADEMVNMIVTQRAYELNSRAISSSDEMLQTANNMKR